METNDFQNWLRSVCRVYPEYEIERKNYINDHEFKDYVEKKKVIIDKEVNKTVPRYYQIDVWRMIMGDVYKQEIIICNELYLR